jgi:hypothetical protein
MEEEKSGIGPGYGSDPKKDIFAGKFSKPGSLPSNMKKQPSSRKK